MATFIPGGPAERMGPLTPAPTNTRPPVVRPAQALEEGEGYPLRDLLTDAVLDRASVSELLEIRGLVESRLPPASLKDIDLERELGLQVKALQGLQARVLGDSSASPQHRAQVANSLSAALANLGKVQESVWKTERVKVMERTLVDCLQHLPKEVAADFLSKYEVALGGL